MPVASFEHLKALVVEDNVHMRTLLRSLLKSLGLRKVYEAADGESAFRLLCVKLPDFVLTDLTMKPMDGLSFTRLVRLSPDSPNPYVPIIMVTGHSERHRVEAARDAGVTEVLAKPITAQSLFLRIAEIVERPRPYMRCVQYFGPDRRRHNDLEYGGPLRRKDDFEKKLEIK